MESIFKQIIDWVFVGTNTEAGEMTESTLDVVEDPLAGNRDGLGHLAAPEDDTGGD